MKKHNTISNNINLSRADVINIEKNWLKQKEEEIEKESLVEKNIINIIKKKLSNIRLKPNTIHIVIKNIIELVEETTIRGIERKELALKILRELFKDLQEGEDELILLKLLDDNSISNIIDLVIDATKNKININKISNPSINRKKYKYCNFLSCFKLKNNSKQP